MYCKPKIAAVTIITMMMIPGRVQSGRISGRCAMNHLLLLCIVCVCWHEGVDKSRVQIQAQTIEPYFSPTPNWNTTKMRFQNESKMKVSGLQDLDLD